VGGDAGEQQAADAAALEQIVELRVGEGAIAMFDHDRLVRTRCDHMEIGAPRTSQAARHSAADAQIALPHWSRQVLRIINSFNKNNHHPPLPTPPPDFLHSSTYHL